MKSCDDETTVLLTEAAAPRAPQIGRRESRHDELWSFARAFKMRPGEVPLPCFECLWISIVKSRARWSALSAQS